MRNIFTLLLLCTAFVSSGSDFNSSNKQSRVNGSAVDTIPNTVLPVTIVSFSGKLMKDYVKLDWTYADESETREIIIEKSTGAEDFKGVGVMNISAIPSHIRGYSFIDSFPAEGKNRYRLKFVYPDNQFQRSFIISVDGKESGMAVQSVYPNPFNDILNVQWHADAQETVIIRLLDMSGKVSFQANQPCVKGNNNYSFSGLGKLVPGYYAMQIVTSAGILQQKLVKSR